VLTLPGPLIPLALLKSLDDAKEKGGITLLTSLITNLPKVIGVENKLPPPTTLIPPTDPEPGIESGLRMEPGSDPEIELTMVPPASHNIQILCKALFMGKSGYFRNNDVYSGLQTTSGSISETT
jgi:hypothetical protein